MFETERPIIKLKLSFIDHALNIVSIAVTSLMWIYVIVKYPQLPEIIPTHYGADGLVDGYGDKWSIFMLPAITSIIIVLFNILNRYPHKFNYLTTITKENAEKQYQQSTRILRILQFNISLLFSYIVYKSVRGALTNYSSLEWWFLPVLLISMIAPTFYMVFSYQSQSKKKSNTPKI
jgi:uncharacterized membrane protein